MRIILGIIFVFGVFFSVQAQAQSIFEIVSGRILLQVEENGEAWYVYPESDTRFYLGRPADAFSIMRELGLGITNADLAGIPEAGSSITGDNELKERLSGYILLQVEEHGEAWYVYPENLQRYYLGRPDDAFSIMRNLGLGISNNNLAQIPIDNQSPGLPNSGSEVQWSHEERTVSTARGNFLADIITMNRTDFRLIVDVAELDQNPNIQNCERPCAVRSLKEYVEKNDALLGIHGSYFCPSDYPDCQGREGEFLAPLVDTDTKITLNDHKMIFHFGPMLVQDTQLGLHFYHRTKEFESVTHFEETTGKQLYSAIANYPSLIESGSIVVFSEETNSSQTDVNTARGGIGYNNESIFLVIAHSADVIDLAYIFQQLNAEYAMNLDGGGSASMYADGSYVFGPGRSLPNAIVFQPIR